MANVLTKASDDDKLEILEKYSAFIFDLVTMRTILVVMSLKFKLLYSHAGWDIMEGITFDPWSY
jgi:hypothetical protein